MHATWTYEDSCALLQSCMPHTCAKMAVLHHTAAYSCDVALVNNRKNKIIPSYELEIRLNWAGSVAGEEAKGKVVLPYVSDENSDEEPEVRRSVKPGRGVCCWSMREKGLPAASTWCLLCEQQKGFQHCVDGTNAVSFWNE
eukprot:1149403-Pelagomonas_calceolata.AAC.10